MENGFSKLLGNLDTDRIMRAATTAVIGVIAHLKRFPQVEKYGCLTQLFPPAGGELSNQHVPALFVSIPQVLLALSANLYCAINRSITVSCRAFLYVVHGTRLQRFRKSFGV